MISASTFAFALALVVVANAALGWIIWSHLTLQHNSWRTTSQTAFGKIASRLSAIEKDVSEAKRVAPTSLAAEVADLSEAVARLRATHQRFQGRFDATRPRVQDPLDVGDDEISSMLRLQNATPAGPNGSS